MTHSAAPAYMAASASRLSARNCVQPTSSPQVNTIPSQACGHQVIRFMNG